jgi:hypothetical protein
MPKPRIPDAATIIYCVACRKATNGRGWYGPGCQCAIAASHAAEGAHSAGATLNDQGNRPR